MSTGGEAAFPQTYPDDPTKPVWADNALSRGLTKREYVATAMLAALLGGILANPNLEIDDSAEKRAEEAVFHADALLAELAK